MLSRPPEYDVWCNGGLFFSTGQLRDILPGCRALSSKKSVERERERELELRAPTSQVLGSMTGLLCHPRRSTVVHRASFVSRIYSPPRGKLINETALYVRWATPQVPPRSYDDVIRPKSLLFRDHVPPFGFQALPRAISPGPLFKGNFFEVPFPLG